MAARNPTPIGEKFNRLTVLGDAPARHGNQNRRVIARCECGETRDYVLSEVRLGKTKSCGCYKVDSRANVTHGHTVGRKFSPEYHSWAAMTTRCTNPKSGKYADYGGRGIKICDRWSEFENFLADMGPRPNGTSLEREEVDGDYEPGNCVWATRARQSNNTRANTILEHEGRKQSLADWATEFGLAYNTLLARVHRLKWPIEKALTTPPRPVSR